MVYNTILGKSWFCDCCARNNGQGFQNLLRNCINSYENVKYHFSLKKLCVKGILIDFII